jgi:uncharacterized protein (TIGR01777 family)
LSRRAGKKGDVTVYQWDIAAGTIDKEAVREADYIIHLAGAGIADRRWTASRKREIMDSRVQSTALLAGALREESHRVQAVVSASAIGYYGSRGDMWLTEETGPGDGFMEDVCVSWEQAAVPMAQAGLRTVTMRIGLVLSPDGGALPKVVMPMRAGIGAWFGKGDQYYSWIHIDDLCRMLIWAMLHAETGVLNAVGPDPVTNKVFTQSVRRALRYPALLMPAPAFLLRLALVQMADVVLYSARVSSKKVEGLGFQFDYTSLEQAVKNLYGR